MSTKLMTNIDPIMYTFIDVEAKKNKLTKRALLERIISNYMENKKHRSLVSAYKEMWNDTEYLNEMKENSEYLSYL